MAAAGKVDEHGTQHIVKSLATCRDAAEKMICILSGFDNGLSSMIDLFPPDGPCCSSLTGAEGVALTVPAAADRSLNAAEEVIQRWDSSDSLLWEASAGEAAEYLDAVRELVSLLGCDSCSEEFRARADTALQISMGRLEEEFRHLMIRSKVLLDADGLHSTNRCFLLSFASDSGDAIEEMEGYVNEDQHPASIHEERRGRSFTINRNIDLVLPETLSDLKKIAERMILAGYGKEVSQVYSSARRDVLDECLSILGFEPMSIEEVQRTEWRILDEKMKKWIQVTKVIIKIILKEEKRLCQHIFESSDELMEGCFMGAAKSCIMQVLNFGGAISICPRSAEKLFRTLEMYESLADVIPDLQSLFSAEAKTLLCGEAEGILKWLGEVVRGILMEFANSVQKDVSRRSLQGGDVHPITRYVMNYVKLFVDYSNSLNLLLDEKDLDGEGKGDGDQVTPLSHHLLMLMSYLESNVEEKSKHYDDVGLQCIFLMNNILYMVQKVRDSELLELLGDNWVRKHRARVKQYATSYLRASWTRILSYLKDDGLRGASKQAIKERFKNFNLSFEEIYRNQTSWKVPDSQLQEDLRISISENVIPAYRAFLGRFGGQLDAGRQAAKYIKYSPEELENYISVLFAGLKGSSNHPWRKLSS